MRAISAIDGSCLFHSREGSASRVGVLGLIHRIRMQEREWHFLSYLRDRHEKAILTDGLE